MTDMWWCIVIDSLFGLLFVYEVQQFKLSVSLKEVS